MSAKTFVPTIAHPGDVDFRAPQPLASRVELTYTCSQSHETTVTFWTNAEVPGTWKCKVCSRFAALPGVELVDDGPYRAPSVDDWEPKNHLDQLYERRTRDELEALLQERLDYLRARRKVC